MPKCLNQPVSRIHAEPASPFSTDRNFDLGTCTVEIVDDAKRSVKRRRSGTTKVMRPGEPEANFPDKAHPVKSIRGVSRKDWLKIEARAREITQKERQRTGAEVTLVLNRDNIKPDVIQKVYFLPQPFLIRHLQVVPVATRHAYDAGKIVHAYSGGFPDEFVFVVFHRQHDCGIVAYPDPTRVVHARNVLQDV
jgi:hypothetical protein